MKLRTLTFLLSVLASSIVHAERADRDKPVHLESDKVTVDDVKRIHIFEGNVVLTQGTIVLRSAKLVVTQDAQGFQKGVATGGADGLARFRQKRDGKDEYVEGEGERIEYESRTEQAEFFNRAHVKSGMDEVRGHYIKYDGLTEQYLVTAIPGAKPGTTQGRVSAVIQPKSASTPPTTAPAPAR
jgi:lipopolysaccharide export system protein LptA